MRKNGTMRRSALRAAAAAALLAAGLGACTPGRNYSPTDNVSLPDLPSYASLSLVSRRRETANAEIQRRRLSIRAPGVATQVISLSGGNQQKVVLAKWLSMKPRVMIFDEPTRGVDVGAKKEIYEMLRGLADAGVAVLMISSDMEEVIGVSDRIAVMNGSCATA